MLRHSLLVPALFVVGFTFAISLFSPTIASAEDAEVQTLGLLLFEDFEILDACGPLEVWGNLKSKVRVVTVAAKKGSISSAQGPALVAEFGYDDCPKLDMLLVPGGLGAFQTLKDAATLEFLRKRSAEAKLTMSVCNGASLLAAAGLLDGRPATTNKAYWKQSTAPGPQVKWVRQARWVDDGNVVTSSGVSAGIDMTLHVVERLYGPATADRLADEIEYERHRDADWDPFAEKNAKPKGRKRS
ncbi:MAG: DJ-1/PfpI family protein [Pirellula sp.]|nr:DJ-1/PfpI family protein [Pirellula sp.]